MTGLIEDTGFDHNRTENYKLSIQVSLDGFYFSIIHPETKRLLALDHLAVNLSTEKFIGRRLEEWFINNEILRKKFEQTFIYYHTPKFTFIPSEFYSYEKQNKVAALVLGKQNGFIYKDNYLPGAEGNLVFAVPSSLPDVLSQYVPGIKLFHPLYAMDQELHKTADNSGSNLLLYFHGKSFYLLLYSAEQPVAVNSFSWFNSSDVLYYALSLMKQLKINPSSTALFLAGEINTNSDMHNELKKYFKRTVCLTPEVIYNSEIFREPLHRFIVLF
jgi:hypothetical protein